jgi:hypothetical protein
VIVAVRNSVRPNHLFDHNLDHDYSFELPCWERDACQRDPPMIIDHSIALLIIVNRSPAKRSGR